MFRNAGHENGLPEFNSRKDVINVQSWGDGTDLTHATMSILQFTPCAFLSLIEICIILSSLILVLVRVYIFNIIYNIENKQLLRIKHNWLQETGNTCKAILILYIPQKFFSLDMVFCRTTSQRLSTLVFLFLWQDSAFTMFFLMAPNPAIKGMYIISSFITKK